VPISVTPGALILMCLPELKDTDCIGLEDELLLLPITGKRSQHLEDLSSEAKRKRVELAVPPSNDECTMPPSTANTTALDTAPVPEVHGFQLTYVCDMEKGMQVLHSITKEAELKVEFPQLFFGLQYHRSTVHAACTLFHHAMSFGLIDEFISYGRTDNGKWLALREAVNTARKGEFKC